MTRYLISISIGPVQEFIAAARRTADLYAGSQLLVKVVGAAAGSFNEEERIFPVKLTSGGANKILAVVDSDPGIRVAQAKSAARDALLKAWEEVEERLQRSGQLHLIKQDRAETQLQDFLEFYAAWVPLPPVSKETLPEEQQYAEARKQVERLLAGRKALREFGPVRDPDEGIVKSPLDPGRASVIEGLADDQIKVLANRKPLRLKGNEELDALSVLKRVQGEALATYYEDEKVLSTRTLAQLSMPGGVTAAQEQADRADEAWTPEYAYYAVLVADGDRMGRLLNDRPSEDEHRDISTALDDFAKEAHRTVQDCQGQAVYTGGDDVLALLPVSRVLDCANDLQALFRQIVGKHDLAEKDQEPKVTLSVGVAIVHYLEPLSVALEYGRAAEKLAKQERNALAVALHTRSGSVLKVRQGWATFTLPEWVRLAGNDEITRGLPYELQALAREWPEDIKQENGDLKNPERLALSQEVRRILRRKREKESDRGNSLDSHPTETELLKEKVRRSNGQRQAGATPDDLLFDSRQELLDFSNLLVLARFLSRDALRPARILVGGRS